MSFYFYNYAIITFFFKHINICRSIGDDPDLPENFHEIAVFSASQDSGDEIEAALHDSSEDLSAEALSQAKELIFKMKQIGVLFFVFTKKIMQTI